MCNTHMYTHTRTHTHKHAHVHAHTHTHTHTHTYTNTNTHTRTHARTHAHTHTHTHTVVLSDPPDPELGEVTLRSRQRLLSSDPSHLNALRHTVLSKTMQVRMRASMVLPGVSEGVLPPNAEPVTSGEALHHLAKQVLW